MTTRPISVRELLERVAERLRYGRSTSERAADFGPDYQTARHVQERLEGVVDAVIDLVRNRSFREANRLLESLADPDVWPLQAHGRLTIARAEFTHVCQRIEEALSLLAALPAEAPAGFFTEFNRDIATLGVVADWCEDYGYQHSAAQARHLLTLLCQLL